MIISRYLFLTSYGEECYRHSFLTLKTNIRYLFFASCIRSRMLPPFISDAKDKHPTFIFSVIQSRMLPLYCQLPNQWNHHDNLYHLCVVLQFNHNLLCFSEAAADEEGDPTSTAEVAPELREGFPPVVVLSSSSSWISRTLSIDFCAVENAVFANDDKLAWLNQLIFYAKVYWLDSIIYLSK